MHFPTRLVWATLATLFTVTAAWAAVQPAPPAAAPADPKALEFFEKRVRPVLAEQCYSCHSAANVKGGLRLDSRAAMVKGGASGPVLAPGAPEKSRLLDVLSHIGAVRMPPQGKLKPQQIADLTEWVRLGALWPEVKVEAGGAKGGPADWARRSAHWAFQPVRAPAVPRVKNTAWVKNPVDAFVLARLEARGMAPAPAADRRTLLRRVSFDLTGIPPSPEQVDAFLGDRSPDAWEKVVDRLLASSAYGERWARHWLDVARYADSNGLDENTAFANAWRYRDWVVRMLNRDLPYNEFVVQQVAGDLLHPAADAVEQYDRVTATAFLVLGPKVLAEPDKQKMLMDIVDEQVDVTSRAFLGLTLSCARCHDHKFDPLTQKDYYGLAGIFKSTRAMQSLATVARAFERPLAPAEKVAERDAWEKKVAALKEQVKKAQGPEKQRLNQEVRALEAAPPDVPMALAVEEAKQIENCRVHLRGNHLTLGDAAPRQFPVVLAGGAQAPVPAGRSGRLELAQWLSRADNPLTGRVLVNRVWLHHFGQGIVGSPDNFGLLGERPSHPELLDWLAAAFVAPAGAAGTDAPVKTNAVPGLQWSMKRLHRLLVTSNSYRMSSRYDARAEAKDPENRLLWRYPRRRLEVEAIRDSMLAVAGNLDRTPGGSLLGTANFQYVTNDQSANQAQYDAPRRSLYLPVIRNAVFDVFQVFDFVEPSYLNGKRGATVVAPQALFLLNGDFVLREARAFAESLLGKPDLDDDARIRDAYLRAFARLPAPAEVAGAKEYLTAYADRLAGAEMDSEKRRAKAWQSLCQALLASNEFVYLN